MDLEADPIDGHGVVLEARHQVGGGRLQPGQDPPDLAGHVSRVSGVRLLPRVGELRHRGLGRGQQLLLPVRQVVQVRRHVI